MTDQYQNLEGQDSDGVDSDAHTLEGKDPGDQVLGDQALGERGSREDYDYFSEDDLTEEAEKKPPREVEGKTSWLYLGALSAIFLLLVLFSWACNDRSSTAGEPKTEDQAVSVGDGRPVELEVVLDGDVVTVSGAVPDDAAGQQVLQTISDLYNAENVINNVMVDEGTTLDGGTITISGAALFDDTRPEALRQALASGLGLDEAGFTVDRGEASVDAVIIDAELNNGLVVLAGVVPDEASIADLVSAGEAVWGTGTIDATRLTVGDSTWTDGMIRVTGSARPGDTRAENLQAEVQNRFGALVSVDASAVAADLSPDSLADIQSEIAETVASQPIRFAPLLAEIDPVSDEVLVSISERLKVIPDINVEVVGHTDSAGSEADNQLLSEQRATAVVNRLVELGVDAARLNARGEGEALPIGDNDTAEGREQNRRIEFLLVAPG